ncbi:uncharacterized protein G2W53_009688 [Senna tora]|uniref:Uncharacterized protein n=1 Tax=Senna tora TaxID=362788 RepID=A0A834WYU5_9FABA|nr:uncharacterized protein G2W53_009688 [Senna tora]
MVPRMPTKIPPFSLDVLYFPPQPEYQKAIELFNVPTIPSTCSHPPLTRCISIHPSISKPHMYTSSRVGNQVKGTRREDVQHAKPPEKPPNATKNSSIHLLFHLLPTKPETPNHHTTTVLLATSHGIMSHKHERITAPKKQIEDFRLLGLVQAHSEGNLAFVKNFYYQAKLYSNLDDLTFRDKLILEINPMHIREQYELPSYPICAYAAGEKDNSLKPVRLQDIIFASIKEVVMHKRKGAKMMFPYLIFDLYEKARVKAKKQDPWFQACGFVNVNCLEFGEPVPVGGTQHRTSKHSKGAPRGGKIVDDVGILSEKIDMLLRRQEDHRRETREAFHFLNRN